MAENTTGIVEKEVAEQVILEVKKLGDNMVVQKDEMLKSYKSLQDELKKESEGSKEKISKLQEDLLTRENELVKKQAEVQSRIDAIELSLKRPGKDITTTKDEVVLLKEATQCLVACMTSKG